MRLLDSGDGTQRLCAPAHAGDSDSTGFSAMKIRRVFALVAVVVPCVIGCAILGSPRTLDLPETVVADVTQLNPIAVGSVLVPTTTEEIVDAVRHWAGPIAVGGSRHSMGGQTAAP